jgi:leader peptidase (prepilin peptidase)/N-methyltransferase
MHTAVAILALPPSLAVGSFLNVVASRLPLGRSVATPASACPHCGAEIRPRDNIPLLSYALLRGRCRDCKAPIGWRYPAVELATALLVAGCFAAFGLSLHALAAAVFCVALVAISAIDIERRIVPNRIVLPATVVVLALMLAWKPSVEWPVAGFGAALFLFLAALVYPAGMGMGDVKLALLLGVAVGRSVPVAVMAGMLAALVPSAVLLVRHGTAARKMGIPFAPFLAFGGVVALFAGDTVVHWYLTYL